MYFRKMALIFGLLCFSGVSFAQYATILALRQTEPVYSSGDAADDIAIWIHPSDASQSRIIGTDKKAGLAVYDLKGTRVQFLHDGEMNNVDLRSHFIFQDNTVALVAASNRSDNSIAFYRMEPDKGSLVRIPTCTKLNHRLTIYGNCLYQNPADQTMYSIATSKSGHVEQWRIWASKEGCLLGKPVRRMALSSVVEACAADDEEGMLYLSEESKGLWQFEASPTSRKQPILVDHTGSKGHLVADVEGIALLKQPNGKGYILVSSQGDNSFAVYERQTPHRWAGQFHVRMGNHLVQDTDGIEANSANLGSDFATGLLVVQDGENPEGNQNFKMVPWAHVQSVLKK